MGFDELNVLKQSQKLYENLYADCRSAWKELYRDRYIEMWLYLKDEKPDEDEVDELLELEMSGLLYEANPVTKYILDAEVLRKRDRMWESLLASPTKTQKQLALDRAVRVWMQMAGWYTDFTSQDAELKAFEEAGITRVRRHEQNDDRVCALCRSLDGKIYQIDEIPVLEHLRCRRWFELVE